MTQSKSEMLNIKAIGGLFALIVLIYDRILFRLFLRSYYKKIFNSYGDNIRWGKHGLRLTIPRTVRLSCPEKISIGDNCQFDEFVYLQAHHEGEGLYIRNNVRVNAFTHIQAYSRITLEDHVLIAPFCHVNSGNHGMRDKDSPIMLQPYVKAGPITIGTGSWLGRNSHVLGNVSLGVNCVVACGAVVTKSFPNFTVVGGVPAKVLKRHD